MIYNNKKYKWKNRLIVLLTPNYTNDKYKKSKEEYEKNIKEFHKRYTKLITKRNKDFEFKILLIGYDGTLKKTYKQFKSEKIIKEIDLMPMEKDFNKIKVQNLSLYSDYNKNSKTSYTKGTGFKDKEKAINTLKLIKNKPLKYQMSLINTMIGRAENHPYKTNDMKEAIKIFKKWKIENKK